MITSILIKISLLGTVSNSSAPSVSLPLSFLNQNEIKSVVEMAEQGQLRLENDQVILDQPQMIEQLENLGFIKNVPAEQAVDTVGGHGGWDMG